MNFKVLYIVRKLIYGTMIMYGLIPYIFSFNDTFLLIKLSYFYINQYALTFENHGN